MTPFEAPTDEARSSAAAPATIAAEAEVPVTVAVAAAGDVVRMLSPGAARNVAAP